MKIKIEKVNILANTKSVQLLIDIPVREWKKAHEFKAAFNKECMLNIEEVKKKRSLDANAYLWVLIGKLAEHYKLPTEEIYRMQIRDCGVYEIIPIRAQNVKNWIDVWHSHGIGWICEDMGECRNVKGYHNIKSYYGTSVYDTKQMSRIIDEVVRECTQCGIETATPQEIERIKATWQ